MTNNPKCLVRYFLFLFLFFLAFNQDECFARGDDSPCDPRSEEYCKNQGLACVKPGDGAKVPRCCPEGQVPRAGGGCRECYPGEVFCDGACHPKETKCIKCPGGYSKPCDSSVPPEQQNECCGSDECGCGPKPKPDPKK